MIAQISRTVVLFFLGIGFVCAAAPSDKDKNGKADFEVSKDEQRLIDLVNEAREKENLAPLKANQVLFEVARAHAANMAQQRKLSHVLDGKDVGQRLKDAGYVYTSGAENIAAGRGQAVTGIFKGWMKSPGHRANILGQPFREIGIGMAKGADHQTYYVQVFGKAWKQ